MQDPFAAFDDSLFAKTNSDGQKPNLKKTYNAKVCSDLWFLQERFADVNIDRHSSKEDVQLLKHQADFHYYKNDWNRALDVYLQIIKGSSGQRCCHEEAARCLLALNRPAEALTYAQAALDHQVGHEQKVPIYVLLSDVHHALQNCVDSLTFIERAISFLPTNPDLWRRLAAVSLNNCVCSSLDRRGSDVNPAAREAAARGTRCVKCQLTGVTAAVRARNLYHYLQRQNKAFIHDRSGRLADEMNETLQSYAAVFKLDELELALQKFVSDHAPASACQPNQVKDDVHASFMSRFLPFLSDVTLYSRQTPSSERS